MTAAPGDYPHSSYAHNAFGFDDALLTPHACYLDLAADRTARQQAYRRLFRTVLDAELLARIRKSTNACGVIGDNRFKEQIEAMLGRAVPTGRRGRPKLDG